MRGSKLLKHNYRLKATYSFIAMLMIISASANDVKAMPLNGKPSVPINYYAWFMIAVATSYTIYLVVRAKRRAKRRYKGE